MKRRNLFWGIFFLAAAVFVIASAVGAFVHFGFWSIVATVLLAAVFFSSLIDLNFFGIFISAALLYLIFEQPFNLYPLTFWQLILAAILASIGLSTIFHSHRRWGRSRHYSPQGSKKAVEKIDGNDIYTRSSFNESCKYLHSDSLKKAHLVSSFGKLSVYFDQVQLSPESAEVRVDVSFGEMVLYLPKNWNVENYVETGLGSVNEDVRSDALDERAPKLKLSGRVSFGQLDIRYI